jgi:hypothetical protein
MKKSKVEAWFAGEIKDEDLTDKDIEWLQEAVFDAVCNKIIERDKIQDLPQSTGIH